MSALPTKVDIRQRDLHARYVPRRQATPSGGEGTIVCLLTGARDVRFTPKADIAGKPRLSPQSREYSSQSHRALHQARLDHRQFAG